MSPGPFFFSHPREADPLRMLFLATALAVAAPQAGAGPADLVNPFVGTLGDHGQLHPGAVAPFGMVSLGPETEPQGHSGYDYAGRSLKGFSHNRASGVGCDGAGGNLLISARYADATGAWAVMDKQQEAAHPGYYTTRYDDGTVTASMAASGQSGILEFRFTRPGSVVLRLDAGTGRPRLREATLHRVGPDGVDGDFSSATVCDKGTYKVHFSTRITPLSGVALAGMVQGERAVEYRLTVPADGRVILRTGLSVTDAASADKTRQRETDGSDVPRLAAATKAAWDRELSRIRLPGTDDQARLLYSMLYVALQTPYRISDAEGRYRGNDGQVRQDQGFSRYSGWAMWDNYRTQMPLLALIAPDRAADIARSLTELYGEGKPQWSTPTEPYISVRTEHSGIALLDFHRKGIPFDAAAALRGMVAESDSLPRRSPDQMIESAYDDWATAELAADLGQTERAGHFRAKALSYRPMWQQVFETVTDKFDIVGARGLYQGTLWQYRWAPVFDMDFLLERLGQERFNVELARFFAQDLYNITNQPSIHTPWLFALSGQPERMPAILSHLLHEKVAHGYTNSGKRPEPTVEHAFALAPKGFADGMDDDFGGMSSWYVWGRLGLYPVVPGRPIYALSIPQQPLVEVQVGKDKWLRIERTGNPASQRIQRITLNGRTIDRPWLTHDEIAEGGLLRVELFA